MPNQLKPSLTYQQQIQKLIGDKGLIILDQGAAQKALEDIGYYALIDGYKVPFYDFAIRKYKNDTTFEDILALYYFDEQLRNLVFRYICHFEQKMRSLIAYYFSQMYSPSKYDYLNSANYDITFQNASKINDLIKILRKESEVNTVHSYIMYQRNTYGDVPIWAVMNTLSFGQMSKMYSYMKPSIKTKISKHFKSVTEKNLCQYLSAITLFRNVCAHNERLFSYKCRLDIPDTILHTKLRIPKNGNSYAVGKNDLFSVVIALRYLLSKSDFLSFKKDLIKIIDNTVNKTTMLTESILLAEMGFPSNWKSITLFRNI